MTQIDEKALQAAAQAYEAPWNRHSLKACIEAYLSALPPPAGEVGELVERLREWGTGDDGWVRIDEAAAEACEQAADALTSLSARLAETNAHWEKVFDFSEDQLQSVNKDRLAAYDQLASANARAERAERERDEARELVAALMFKHSIATGHGDNLKSLLSEFDWQLARRSNRAERLEAALREAREWLDKYLDATREGEEPAVRGGLLGKLVAALSPAPAGGDGWRDIASAPEGELVQVATPSIEESSKLWVGTARVYHADEGRFEGHLANIAHYNGAIFVTRFHARYWRPLPASPSKGGA